MLIRRAEERDMPRIRELLLQVANVHHAGRPDLFQRDHSKYSDEELLAILRDETTPVLVAVDGGERVLGYAFCIYEQPDGEHVLSPVKTLYIDDLCVDEACRGQGVGSRLYRAVLDLARGTGCYNVTLNVWSCNGDAMAFYEKMGLRPQKIGMEQLL